MPVKCFLMSATGHEARWLRRYWRRDEPDACSANPGYTYHQALVPIETAPYADKPEVDRTDPRWPKQCGCGYVFRDEDSWQVFTLSLYAYEGKYYVLHMQPPEGAVRAPAGAMWFSHWCPGPKNVDPALWVMLPNNAGCWCIDGSSSSGAREGWTRTGEPPMITAHPSIQVGDRYHGRLIDGELRPEGDSPSPNT